MARVRNKHNELNANKVRERCLYVRKILMQKSALEAAKAMGYTNSSQVSKMECLSSSTGISHNYIHRLSKWAGVSKDFIYGDSDYPERDPKTVEQMAVFNASREFAETFLEKFSKEIMLGVEQSTVELVLSQLAERCAEFEGKFQRLLELNPKFFNSARGGSNALNAFTALKQERANALNRLRMIRDNHKRKVRHFEAALEESREIGQIDFVGYE